MKKLGMALAVACGSMLCIHAEEVQNWFSGGVENASPAATSGQWVASVGNGGLITTNATSFTLELDYDEVLDFEPTQADAPDTNVTTRVVSAVTFVPNDGALPTFSESAPRAALIVSNTTYYAYTNGSWIAMAGATPTTEQVNLLLEIKYNTSTPQARFGVISDSATNYLHTAGQASGDWLTLAGSTPSPALVEKIGFSGDGEVASIRGDVQMGLFEVANVKYGTSEEAVAASQLTGGNGTIKVIRDNDEKIVIPEDAAVAVTIDANGHEAGEVQNNSSQNTVVPLASETVSEGSGIYLLDMAASDPTKVTVSTTDESKEVLVTTNAEKQLVAVVRTSTAIMNAVTFDGKAVAPADNEAYRTFLATYCGEEGDAYMKANTTAGEIQTQLGTNADNGLPLWESYVLDLDPEDTTSKPAAVVKPAAENKSNMILTVPTYKATLPTSNYTVTYVLKNLTDGTSETIDNPAAISVPFDGDQYRVDTVITPNN